MKIQLSVRDVYDVQRPLFERLKADVDATMHATKQPRWHYESRVKTPESFATKVETGRVAEPKLLEDFLACTIVVPNSRSIEQAIALVKSRYEIRYRRPSDPSSTRKDANAFPFDDLRLYCGRLNDGSRPEDPLDSLIFEIQIKTFLQHAWGVATHDLTYKTDDVRWSKDRIAAHLKATVEYAEITIEQAEELSKSELLSLGHDKTLELAAIIATLKKHWCRDDLPENIRGLADTLRPILSALKVTASNLDALLQAERKQRGGELPLNLSPYGTVIQLLCAHHAQALDAQLREKRPKFRLMLTPELTLPQDFPSSSARQNIIFVGDHSGLERVAL